MKKGISKFGGGGENKNSSKCYLNTVKINKNNVFILDFVKANPGCHIRSIAHALHLSKSGIIHHLKNLARDEDVRMIRTGKYVRIYPNNYKINRKKILIPTTESVFKVLKINKGLSQSDILKTIGISQPTLSRCLSDLERKRYIVKKVINNKYYYRINFEKKVDEEEKKK